MRSGRTPTASSMSSLDDLHWFRIEGLAPEVTGNDIVSYFQSARCGSGLVKKLMYLDQQKTAAEIGIERIDADGVEKLTTGSHNISGMQQLQIVSTPTPSLLEHAITSPSTYSIASQVLQPLQHVQQHQESMTPNSRIVRVVGILPDWDEVLLKMAFENDDKGGGKIEENGIQIKGNEALITFKDPEVAHRISLKENWKVYGDSPVKVSLVEVQPDAVQELMEKCNQDNTILIEKIPNGITNNYLKLYLKSVTGLKEGDFTLEYKGTMALMVLQGDATDKLETTLANLQSPETLLEGTRLKASRFSSDPVQPIRVANIKEGMCKKANLTVYFENRTISNGGNVDDITIIAEDEAIITFKEAKDAESVLAKDHAVHLGAEVVLMANHQVLSSWLGTATELKGTKSEQTSSISPVMRSTENLFTSSFTCEYEENESPGIDLKVEGNLVQEWPIPRLQLLLEDQVHELKRMIMSIDRTVQDNAVLVQISQAAAAKLNLPMTINNDQLRISTAPVKRQLYRKMPLNDCNSENTVIVGNIPPCESSFLEMYVESEAQLERTAHMMRTDFSPSSALLTRLQGSVEVNEVLKKLNHPEQQLQGCTLSAEPWPEINQIILHCLEEDVTKEFLEAYFKNEGMSGSPTFVEVTMKGKGIAVVTLQGSQDVKCVLKKETHKRFICPGVVLKVYHPKLIPWLELTPQEQRVLTHGDIPHPFDLPITLELYSFLSTRFLLQQALELQLKPICAHFTLRRAQDKGIITVYPEVGSKGPEECRPVVEMFLAKFDTQYIDVPRRIDSKAILEFIVAMRTDKEASEAILSKDNLTISIVGFTDSVKVECGDLNTIIRDCTWIALKEKMELHVLQCIELCQRKALESKHPKVAFKVLYAESTLSVSGEEKQCRKFLNEVSALKPIVVGIQLPPEAIIFLRARENGKKLFQEVMQKYPNVGYYITDSKGCVLMEDLSECAHLSIVTCTDSKQALHVAKEVKKSVTIDTIEVPTEFKNTVLQDCWVESRRRMEAENIALFKPQLEGHPPMIMIVCKADRATAAKTDIKEFVNRQCYTRVVITLKEGQYNYMIKNSEWIEFHGEMKKLQKEKQIVFNLPEVIKSESPKLTVEGFTTKVKQVAQTVRGIQSRICESSICVSMPGLLEYSKSTIGQQQLIGIAAAHGAVLVVRTGEQQKKEETVTTRELPHKTVLCATVLGGGNIRIMQGDLTEYPVDILVNAANTDLQHGGGIAGQISRKGGPEIQAESSRYIREHGRLKEGDAVLLYAKGVLPCKAIIHTVGPKWAGGRANEEETIATAVHGSLHLLAETDSAHYRSIAFPALSTGIYGVPLGVSARGMLAGVRKFFDENANSTLRVVIMLYKEEDIEPFVSSIKYDLECQPFTVVKDTTFIHSELTADISSSRKSTRPPPTQASPSTLPRPSYLKASTASLPKPPSTLGSPATPKIHSERQAVGFTMEISAADKLELQKGALTDYKADVCVNTTSINLDLDSGAVSKSLLAKGGKTLQDQCNKYVKDHGKVPVWGFATTSGGDTPFKYIIHTVGTDYNKGKAIKNMESMIAKVMTECDRLKASSVAFPAIGTGVLGFPHRVAARIMVQVVHQYLQQHPFTSVKKVTFVIFQDKVFDEFQREMRTLISAPTMPSGQSGAPSIPQVLPTPSLTPMVQLPIVVKKGSLIDAQADVYVNSASGSLNLSFGAIAKSLLTAGGLALQEKCTKYKSQNGDVAVWNIATTGGASLKCKHVIHTVGGQYDGATSEMGMKSMVAKIMVECDRLKTSSVAFPALGTGVLGFPHHVAARILLQGAFQYLQENPRTSVKEIIFAIYQDAVLSAFQNEVDSICSSSAVSSVLARTPQFSGMVPVLHVESLMEPPVVSSQSLPIIVKKGLLTDAKADVYVNTSNGSLDLSNGAVAKSLSEAGGPTLQEKCTEFISANGAVAMWNIATTGGAKLMCKHVIHTVGDHYNGKPSEKGMERMIGKVMEECDRLKASSVAFPALGTGALRFPNDVMAKIMVQETYQYLQRNPNSSVKEISFYIFQDEILSAFQTEVEALMSIPAGYSGMAITESLPAVLSTHAGSSPRAMPVSDTWPGNQASQMRISRAMVKELFVGKLRIHFVKGNITEECSGCLVNVASPGPKLLDTGLQGDFLQKGGQQMQLAYTLAAEEMGNLTKGKIIETAGPVGDLESKLVCHVCPPDVHKELKGMVKSVLQKAEKFHIQSVAFPMTLECGQEAFPVDEVAEYYYRGIASFIKDPFCYLAEIICIDPEERLTCQFIHAFEKAASKDGSGLVAKSKQAWSISKRRFSGATALFKKQSSAPLPLSSILGLRFEEEGPAMWFTAYAGTEAVAISVIKKVEELVNTQFREEVIDDLNIKQLQLQPHTTDKLYCEAERKHVKLRLEDCKIILQGHEHNTEQLKNTVHNELSRIATTRERICRKEAELQKEQAELRTQQAEVTKEIAESQKLEAERRRQEAEYNSAKKEQELEQIRTHGERPDDWDTMDIDPLAGTEVPYMAVDISTSSTEYTKVESQFSASMGASGSLVPAMQLPYRGILKIQRIQNPVLYGQYIIRKKAMDKANQGNVPNERQLFHGCPRDVIDSISSTGFNRSYCNEKSLYGEGVYFAKDAAYSARDRYSKQDTESGHKYMYLARVLVGKYTKGDKGIKKPPATFDSVVNDVDDPGIFVVFYDGQAYPEYLITFH